MPAAHSVAGFAIDCRLGVLSRLLEAGESAVSRGGRLKRGAITSLSVVCMGLGQFVTGEYVKGALFAAVHVLLLVFVVPLLRHSWWGLITLGTEAGRDHSTFLLVQGLLGLIVTVLLGLLYIGNIKDAHTQAKRFLEGKRADSFLQSLKRFWISGGRFGSHPVLC